MDQTQTNNAQRSRGRWKLLAVLAVCASPLIFSYLTYYVIKPAGRTNYGDLIDPRQRGVEQFKAGYLSRGERSAGLAQAHVGQCHSALLAQLHRESVRLDADGDLCNGCRCRGQLRRQRSRDQRSRRHWCK